MATSDDIAWVKARLPKGVTFEKNGLSESVDETIRAAIESAADTYTVTAAIRAYALGDCWEIIESNELHESEKVGDGSWKALAHARSEDWHTRADSFEASGTRGRFKGVAADWGDDDPSNDDEFSR